ncbi:helix-turn-helix transcriptional regulator [Rhizobium ruizarguesonis]|uniref:helix-turn-helix transcriptional regulator n=1 Tax=Rhizobium ruizarguesonis TaxID=2081791 RepID=UPI001FE0894C|nr:helix-turn-helix transcriptional regulator [Rhizobium ruizarguesonis]
MEAGKFRWGCLCKESIPVESICDRWSCCCWDGGRDSTEKSASADIWQAFGGCRNYMVRHFKLPEYGGSALTIAINLVMKTRFVKRKLGAITMFTVLRGIFRMLTTGNQLKAARILAEIEQKELAEKAGLNVNTIRNMESVGNGPIAGRAANVQVVQRILEAEGIEFLNHGRPGVRVVGKE